MLLMSSICEAARVQKDCRATGKKKVLMYKCRVMCNWTQSQGTLQREKSWQASLIGVGRNDAVTYHCETVAGSVDFY
jgi:hypothetical protein